MPLSLTDTQMQTVQAAAEPLDPRDRSRFLERVAELLRGVEIGDGSVSRCCRIAQSELLTPAPRRGLLGVPKYAKA